MMAESKKLNQICDNCKGRFDFVLLVLLKKEKTMTEAEKWLDKHMD